MKTNLNDGRRMAGLRKIIGKSQSQFAAMIGVSIHTVISVENGRNQLSENLARRVQIATGANLLHRAERQSRVRGWRRVFQKRFLKHGVPGSPARNIRPKHVFEEIKYWIELVLRAAAGPGAAGNRDRLPSRLLIPRWLAQRNPQHVQGKKEIDAILEEDPHEIISHACDLEDLKGDGQFAKMLADQLEMTPKELLGKFKQRTRGSKRANLPTLTVTFEVRRAWNPDSNGPGRAFDTCAVKKLLPKAKFEFKRIVHSRPQSGNDQAQARPQPDFPAPHGPEVDPLRLPLRVFVRQVPVNFADQNPAILMPHPLGNRHEINPRHHAIADEVMPQIVKSEPRDFGFRPHQSHRLDITFRRFVFLSALR